MYDTTRPSTLNSHHSWTYIVKERCGRDVPIMLVGNKIDLVNKRAISTEHGIEVAKRSGFTGFSETSAKTGVNIESTFQTIAKLMVKRMKKLEEQDKSTNTKPPIIIGECTWIMSINPNFLRLSIYLNRSVSWKKELSNIRLPSQTADCRRFRCFSRCS